MVRSLLNGWSCPWTGQHWTRPASSARLSVDRPRPSPAGEGARGRQPEQTQQTRALGPRQDGCLSSSHAERDGCAELDGCSGAARTKTCATFCSCFGFHRWGSCGTRLPAFSRPPKTYPYRTLESQSPLHRSKSRSPATPAESTGAGLRVPKNDSSSLNTSSSGYTVPCHSKKSKSPLCVMKVSRFVRAGTYAPDSSRRHAVVGCGGSHWCGWQPSKFAIDDVAKRVCPWNSAGASTAFGLSSDRNLRISRSHKSVRFPLTTRLRTPDMPDLPLLYVTCSCEAHRVNSARLGGGGQCALCIGAPALRSARRASSSREAWY